MYNSQKKIPVGDGDDPGPQLLGHLICLFNLIINIYGLGVGISTIKKFTSGRGGVRPCGVWAIRHLIYLVTLIINIYGLGVGISTIKKFTSGRGWIMTPCAWAIRHLICLVTLIINIYGLGVGISTFKRFTSGRGGVWPRGLSYNAFNLPSHPDHKYIWFRVGISVTFFIQIPQRGGAEPQG
jgi:hypothetical protein